MNPGGERLTYEDMTELRRREQRSKKLSEVRKDLYAAIQECQARLERDYEDESAIERMSTKAGLAYNQLRKFKEIVPQVIELRAEKILQAALRSALGNRVDLMLLTPEERSLYDRTEAALKDAVGAMMRGNSPLAVSAEGTVMATRPRAEVETVYAPLAERPPALETPLPPADRPIPDAPDEAGEEPEAPEEIPDEPLADAPSETIVIRVLRDCPPLATADGDYRLMKEDVVRIDAVTGRALIAGKAAAQVRLAVK